MIAEPFAADAVARARSLPGLHVGLHLVVIEGKPILPPAEIPGLVDATGRFPSAQFRLGLNYFARPDTSRQLAAEIRAQFEAFHATGLRLDHANAHKHMHLHPTVGRMMIEIGRDYGLCAIRVPSEPAISGLFPRNFASWALRAWSQNLRRQAASSGLLTNDHLLGLAWSGGMTSARVQLLMESLPTGLTEIYFHPAVSRDETLRRLMPGYAHEAELAALLNCRLPMAAGLTSYTAETIAEGETPPAPSLRRRNRAWPQPVPAQHRSPGKDR